MMMTFTRSISPVVCCWKAQLIARQLAEAGDPIRRVVQVFRAWGCGREGGPDLQALRGGSGQQIVNRV